VEVTGGDTFGELIKDRISFTPPQAGPVTMTASLVPAGAPGRELRRSEPLLVVDPDPVPITRPIAAADYDGKLIPALKQQFGISAVPLAAVPGDVDTIIISSSGVPAFAWDFSRVD